MTLVCVPIMVEVEDGAVAVERALADARRAAEFGAEVIEWRLDHALDALLEVAPDAARSDAFDPLVADCPVRSIVTCRPAWEGGAFEGDEADRLALLERFLGGAGGGTPVALPAMVDIELATLGRDAAFRARVRLLARAEGSPRVIVSMHDFEGRPADLSRKLAEAYAEPAAAIVKVAFRARSLRDNLELFEILRDAPKPTIALGMGEFGLMSRVLAPKFGGFLTFASLRDESATAPGQPTIEELLGLYRFRSIGRETKVYGVIGWPVRQSLSPLIHNAGFEAAGHDGVYLPMPIVAGGEDAEVDYTSFAATVDALVHDPHMGFCGASVTMPFKLALSRFCFDGWDGVDDEMGGRPLPPHEPNNTLLISTPANSDLLDAGAFDTDRRAIFELVGEQLASAGGGAASMTVGVVGAGSVASIAAWTVKGKVRELHVFNRDPERARKMADSINKRSDRPWIVPHGLDDLRGSRCDFFINCTPVGMTGGPDPGGLSIPIPEMKNLPEGAVFFDTVYNPIETPMLRAAKERGFRTIDGVEMFVRQAAAQFELWTGKKAPVDLFDRLCREKLSSAGG